MKKYDKQIDTDSHISIRLNLVVQESFCLRRDRGEHFSRNFVSENDSDICAFESTRKISVREMLRVSNDLLPQVRNRHKEVLCARRLIDQQKIVERSGDDFRKIVLNSAEV